MIRIIKHNYPKSQIQMITKDLKFTSLPFQLFTKLPLRIKIKQKLIVPYPRCWPRGGKERRKKKKPWES